MEVRVSNEFEDFIKSIDEEINDLETQTAEACRIVNAFKQVMSEADLADDEYVKEVRQYLEAFKKQVNDKKPLSLEKEQEKLKELNSYARENNLKMIIFDIDGFKGDKKDE